MQHFSMLLGYVLKNVPDFPCQVSAGHARALPGERNVNMSQVQTQGLCLPVHLVKRQPKKFLCPHEDLKFITYSRKGPAFRIKCVELEYYISYCRKHNYTWFHSLAFGLSAQKYCLSRMPCHPLLQGNTHGTSPREMEIYWHILEKAKRQATY